jgi:hypothetical protein
MDEIEKLVWRSRNELPYPYNYMATKNPVLAAMMVKALIDWPKEKHRGKRQ